MNYKQLEVYNILLTPIIADKKAEKIRKQNGIIISPQIYYSSVDADMCDFAIGFYETLYYDNLLKSTNMLNDKKLRNECYAGDTMNSFNTIANLMKGISWDSGNITINPYLLYYKVHYHCLANFWVIPMKHGRKSAKRVARTHNFDSPILYTQVLREKFDELSNDVMLKEYFSNLPIIQFESIHYMPEMENSHEIRQLYKNGEGEKLLHIALSFIEKRAKKIVSDDEMTDKLYDYFDSIKLIDY